MSYALTLHQQYAVLDNNLDGYAKTIKTIPMLSADEEHQLAKNLYQEKDFGAARTLIISHLRFVMHIAQSYRGYGISQSDLIQEGNIGLMKAVKRFDPSVGVRLVSFAVHWIRAEIHEYILRNWRIVKVATTKSQRKLFFNLRSTKKRLDRLTQNELEKVAKELGVNARDVREMETRLNTYDVAFEAPSDADDETEMFFPAGYLEDHRFEPAILTEEKDWKDKRHDQLEKALKKLDARSRDIVRQRWLREDRTTLQELAKHHKLSAERIRQIEIKAMDQLKATLVPKSRKKIRSGKN
jgi:RNA polymerase sigma-32 factor